MAHEQPAVRTTIVGGRPPGSGQGIGAAPRGLEVLLKKAAVDAAFRARLLSARAAAAGDLGLELAASERALLAAAPAAQLAAMVDGTRVPERQRAAFLGSAAAVMLAALGLTGCGDQPAPAGIRPQEVPPTQQPGPPVSEGIRPDVPEQREDPAPAPKPDPVPTSRGVRPDLPPVRDDEVQPTKGIRPDLPVRDEPAPSPKPAE